MNFEKWLTIIPIRQTPTGARVDLRLYIYPDGHGNFCIEDESGRLVNDSQPVNNLLEARDVLEKLWNRAMNLPSDAAITQPRQPTLAEQFADVIGIAPDLPHDMAEHHDQYIHGTVDP